MSDARLKSSGEPEDSLPQTPVEEFDLGLLLAPHSLPADVAINADAPVAKGATVEPEPEPEAKTFLLSEGHDCMWFLAQSLTRAEAKAIAADLMSLKLEEMSACKVWVRELSSEECEERQLAAGWHEECEINAEDAVEYWRVWPFDYDWIWGYEYED